MNTVSAKSKKAIPPLLEGQAGAVDLVIQRSSLRAGAPTRAMCEAASMLGVSLESLSRREFTPAELRLTLEPGCFVLVTGPSGCGKSTLLRDMVRELDRQNVTVVQAACRRPAERPCVSLVASAARCDVRGAMGILCRAGLGDASAFIRRPGELSAGQLERLKLALALARVERRLRTGEGPVVLVLDELGAALDGATAMGLARLLSLACERNPRLRVVAATPRRELAAFGSLHVEIDEAGRVVVRNRDSRSAKPNLPVRFEAGTLEDYEKLSALHYRAGAPATIVRVLRAIERRSREVVGVLTVSMPVLNASWRSAAWPGRFDGSDKRGAAERINRELRCISRVIVAPAWRSLGIATGLVRTYLDDPLTVCTEAVAAMGRMAPFFEAAGMTAHRIERSACDARLLDVLRDAEIEPWRLAMPESALERARESLGEAVISAELRRWATGSRATRRAARTGTLDELMKRAAMRLACEPVAFCTGFAG